MQKATLADCCIASLETKPHAVHAHPPSTLPRKLNANIAAAVVIAGPQAIDVQRLAQMCGHPVLCCSGRALRAPTVMSRSSKLKPREASCDAYSLRPARQPAAQSKNSQSWPRNFWLRTYVVGWRAGHEPADLYALESMSEQRTKSWLVFVGGLALGGVAVYSVTWYLTSTSTPVERPSRSSSRCACTF